MPEPVPGHPTGPAVQDDEDAYRAILHPMWWDFGENRPSSAAFDDDVFSVDIASRTSPQQTLDRFGPGSGLVSFNCGEARQLNFHTHDERDENAPANTAHAHVYDMGGSPKRKKRARKLAKELTKVVQAPAFPS